ncbi:MAG: polyribonucleotide nucleotidyltransferase [Deltaproteobacteria bacterium]|nr:polyribonucleotide nucleotidyltransferase [Deltaproteobacteria bacterium]
MTKHHIVSTEIGGRKLTIETGKMAKQAGGSAVVRYGDTIVLVTATVKPEPSINQSFLPLTVEYVEKTFAAGKIPGGFFKREGRPTEMATLTSRFIDRPIRPLFPEGYFYETQVIATVLSVDEQNDPDMLAIIGASTALMLSNAPFQGPIAGVRVGRLNGQFILNPTPEQDEQVDLDVVVAGSRDAVVMVEGGAGEASEADMIAAITFAHREMQPLLALQEQLAKLAGAKKIEVAAPAKDAELEKHMLSIFGDKLEKAITIPTKQERYAALDGLKKEVVEKFAVDPENLEQLALVKETYSTIKKNFVRNLILNTGKRIDGRSLTDVRPITCEVGLLPRTHGSALFTRGETQVLAVTTLGTKDDQQIIDGIEGEYYKRFMLHYNFPPFSVGEVKRLSSPGRREVGHGALAERALKRMLPAEDEFPYTVRIVSETLESNGSSSMGTVCGSTLALMDAGVPLRLPVAGVAMGLIQEGDRTAVLTDILGDEDHLGDMDFKITGTRTGVTAIQMDIKVKGLSESLLVKALEQARVARLHILNEMEKALKVPREHLSPFAPKLTTLMIPRDMIGALIGPGGKNIRNIIETTGAKVDVEDDGRVTVAAVDQEAGNLAIKMIKGLTAVPEIGKYYRGTVRKIMEFGAFVEVLPGTDGLCHISQLDEKRVAKVEDVVKEGDEMVVKVLEIDPKTGKIRLSRKEAFGHENEVEA